MTERIFIDNDNRITVDELRDADGQYQNDATVQVVELRDAGGNPVTGQSWPLTLSYVAGSNGRYEGILQDTLELDPDERLTAVIDIDAGGLHAHWDKTVVAVVRR